MFEWLILGMIIFGFAFGLVNFIWLCKIQKQLDEHLSGKWAKKNGEITCKGGVQWKNVGNAPPERSEAPSRRSEDLIDLQAQPPAK